MKYIEGFNRNQSILFPQCIDEIIPEDSEVRIIDAFVDSLPLKDLGFLEHQPSEEGRPMYHPKDLFKLYVYGYLNRIRTSRLLERECERNIELIWLLKGLRPCFRTIAGFRSENPEAFRNTFRHFVSRLNKSAFLGRKVVAIDGTKFRAVNSKKNNFNQKKIDRQLAYIDEKISQYMHDLDEGDLTESKREDIQQKVSRHRKQKRKYKQIEKQLHASGEDQISTTDPDARSMIIHGQVVEVAYNVQTVVDNKNHLIVEYEPTNRNDKKALLPMSIKAREACGVEAITVLADKGYHNGEQIDSCAGEHITTYVATPAAPRNSAIPTNEYYGDKFRYNKQRDTYTCPQGHVLKSNGSWYKRKYEQGVTRVKHYKTAKCKTCPAQIFCTSTPTGRVIERSEYTEAIEANTRRIRKHAEIYSARQQIIEHVFGTIKRQWGYNHILLKGLLKNDGEFGLIYLIYNLRRIINILGVEGVKKWIRKEFCLILNLLHSTKTIDRKLKINFSAVTV
jgi:transposase